MDRHGDPDAQREVGGDLAEILHTVADTLREREYLRRQVKALSAEGRLSGYILTAMPPGSGSPTCCSATATTSELLYTTVPGSHHPRGGRFLPPDTRRVRHATSSLEGRGLTMSSPMLFCSALACCVCAMILALSMIGVITAEPPRRSHDPSPPCRLSTPRPACWKAEIEQPFVERVIAPLGERLVGLGRALAPRGHCAQDPVPTRRRRQPAVMGRQSDPRAQGTRPRGVRRGGLPLPPDHGLPFYRVSLATRLPQPSATYCPTSCSTTRTTSGDADAQRAPRRHGPTDHLGRGRSRLRRCPSAASRRQARGPAVARSSPGSCRRCSSG